MARKKKARPKYNTKKVRAVKARAAAKAPRSLFNAMTGTMGKRPSYPEKLAALRMIVAGFDSKKLDTLPLTKPKTDKQRAARRKTLAKVSRTFARVRPFVHRSFKAVAPKNKKHFEELKKYVGISSFKGLRAIPVPTTQPKKTRVTFAKDGRVKITQGRHYTEKFFRFPHMPRDVDDAVAMLEEMLPTMPEGLYIIATRHHFLIPTATSKSLLAEGLREFWTQYAAKNPEFVKLIFGFKWLARSSETAHRRMLELRSERGKAKQARQDARRTKVINALAAMDRHFKGNRGEQLLGVPSRAARGLPWAERMPLADAQRIAKNEKRRKQKLSKRARATGRR